MAPSLAYTIFPGGRSGRKLRRHVKLQVNLDRSQIFPKWVAVAALVVALTLGVLLRVTVIDYYGVGQTKNFNDYWNDGKIMRMDVWQSSISSVLLNIRGAFVAVFNQFGSMTLPSLSPIKPWAQAVTPSWVDSVQESIMDAMVLLWFDFVASVGGVYERAAALLA